MDRLNQFCAAITLDRRRGLPFSFFKEIDAVAAKIRAAFGPVNGPTIACGGRPVLI
jgi:hypothetical protein